MPTSLLLVQLLNGLQLGVLLFLVAAGLTVVFGVMDFINLAHGVQYMLGAYIAATLGTWLGSFWAGLLLTLPAAVLLGLLLEMLVFRHLYGRDHLSQVLATFGVILTVDEAVRAIWGSAPLNVPQPTGLEGSIELIPGFGYPVYRLLIIAAGLGVALLLWLLVGGGVLILAFVVIVIGGLGSIRGAFIAALLVGVLDTLGRAMLPDLLRVVMQPSAARQTGAALASMLVYVVMAAILAVRPAGLFPVRGA